MKKNRTSMILNIIGMSISLMAFLVLFVQVWFDYRWNHNIDDHDNIYRFEEPNPYCAWDFAFEATTLRPYIEAFRSCSPDVIAACDYNDFDYDTIFQVKYLDNGTIRKFDIPWTTTDSSCPALFNLKMIHGSYENYTEKNTALLSEKYATIIFGDKNPIGETLTLEGIEWELKVVGIYRTLPENCSIINGILINEGDEDLTFPNYNGHTGFFKLRDGVSPEDVIEDFKVAYSNLIHDKEWSEVYEDKVIPHIRLTPITRIHFAEDVSPGIKPSADRTQTMILLSIALLFLLISIFNYINFAMASIPFMINGINISKVFGADRKTLTVAILKENLLICIAAFALAVILMEASSHSQLASFICCSLAVGDNIPAIAIGLVIATASAVISGLITAFYTTSSDPGLILKGSFSLSGKGRTFRRVSMVVQYALSCTFLACGLLIGRQADFVVSTDNGFKSDNIIHLSCDLYTRWQKSFDKLLENPEILDVTCGYSPMTEGFSSRSQMMSKDNKPVWYDIRDAYHNYFQFFDFKLLEGRFPREGEFGVAIINETYARTYPDQKIGDYATSIDQRQYEIIGVVKDFHARPLLYDNEPMVYCIADHNFADFFFKFDSDDVGKTLNWVKSVMNETLMPGDEIPMNASYLDDDLKNMYSKTLGQARLVTTASLLCILIALIGVFGLVYFETQTMRKEIAVRKVNGATTGGIIRSLLVKYVSICSIGFIIAIPISLIIQYLWLKEFVQHTQITVWNYILAYVVVCILTIAVTLLRSYASASENPTTVLKTE